MKTNLDFNTQCRFLEKAGEPPPEALQIYEIAAEQLCEQLSWMVLEPKRILLLGSRLVHFSAVIQALYPDAILMTQDIASSLSPSLVARFDSMPYLAESFDVVISNVVLQQVSELGNCFKEVERILSATGVFVFAMLGGDSLKELSLSSSHVFKQSLCHDCWEMHNVGDLLVAAGLDEPVIASERFLLEYERLASLFSDIRSLGAQNASVDRMRGLCSKGRWQLLGEAYATLKNGSFPVTVDLILGHAWKSSKKNNIGESFVNVEDIVWSV